MNKEKIIGVRLNEKELEKLEKKAKESGLKLSAYLREKALKAK